MYSYLLFLNIISKSFGFKNTVAVFILGCTPISEIFFISSSIIIVTIWSLSFNIPSGDTDPFVSPKYLYKSSSLANVKGLLLSLFLNSFKLTFLLCETNTK